MGELVATFEDYGRENGMRYWLASEFMKMLGYDNKNEFQKVINKAIKTCTSVGIDIFDNFTKIDGDYKLTRFACYLISMNSDPKYSNVAKAQVYFAKLADEAQLILEGKNDVERINIREEIKVGNTELSKLAKRSGVSEYARFQDAGYRGLYNRSLKAVTSKKGVAKNHKLLDYMGRTELAANLFRISMTEERLKNTPEINTQTKAEEAHRDVGSKVRQMVKDNAGIYPEDLPIERRLNTAYSELKKANKLLNKDTNTKK